MEQQLTVGRRVSVDGELATVRFVGGIPNWPGQIAYGLEWDDPTRGKNNGVLNGVRYFETTDNVASGSFVKQKKIKYNPRTFLDALVYQYGSSEESISANAKGTLLDSFSLQIGSKTLESYGFERLARIQADFRNLEVVTLERLDIVAASNHLSELLLNLKELRMGFNLFNSWTTVMTIVNQLPQLTSLNVNGNRFVEQVEEFEPNRLVTSLSLSSVALNSYSEALVERILGSFPCVTSLVIAGNGLVSLDRLRRGLRGLSHLATLELSLNNLDHIDLEFLSQLGSLNRVNFANNSISVRPGQHAVASSVTRLDLSGNRISKWTEIDILSNQFPNLVALTVTQNPLFASSETDSEAYDLDTVQLLSRLPSLQKLNGTVYTEAQRSSSELYFISKVKTRTWTCQETRWKQLCGKHGLSVHEVAALKPIASSVHELVNLRVVLEDGDAAESFELSVFPQLTTVARLRGKISVQTGLSVLHFQVYFKPGGVVERMGNDQQLLSSLGLGVDGVVYVRKEPWVVT